MSTYPITKDFGIGDSTGITDYIATNPSWLLLVVRLQYPLTYSASKGKSFSDDYSKAIQIRGEPLLIDGDCVSLSVNSQKSNYITSMQANLVPGKINYLSEILPGDYVFAWMANSPETIENVKQKILAGKSANDFLDGLKFMGRAKTIQKNLAIDPNGGAKYVQYMFTANGFTEFDASVFYEPHLAQRVDKIGTYFAKLGAQVNDLIKQGTRGVRGEDAMVVFLDLLLGRGVNKNFGMENAKPEMRSTTGLEAKHAFIIPEVVGSIIGKNEKSQAGGLLAAADLLEVVYGVQKYWSESTLDTHWTIKIEEDQRKLDSRFKLLSESEKTFEQELASSIQVDESDRDPVGGLFAPRGTYHSSSRRFTGEHMLGTFPLTPPQFSGNTVWGIINQYLNPAVNEMYACLRTNYMGKVVPTLVLRQIPFSSDDVKAKVPVTKFLELPRWGVDPILVRSYSLGRSDSLRFNFVHIYGNMTMTKADAFANQVVINPPPRDDLDIARSGLRPYQMTVSCHYKDVNDTNPGQWMNIMSDILMGQHLTFTGNMELVGVQSPICVGDNLEFDGIVFHIETVSHSCQIGSDGKKRFSTLLSLSHGVSANPTTSLLSRYAGIETEDQRTYEPGYTHETGNSEQDGGKTIKDHYTEISVLPDVPKDYA